VRDYVEVVSMVSLLPAIVPMRITACATTARLTGISWSRTTNHDRWAMAWGIT
jgi:hypothetical protein